MNGSADLGDTYEPETEPMATHLATVNIGKFTILRVTTASGVPIVNGVRPDQLTDTARTRLAHRQHQTRPEFTSANGLSALAHELAHQWFGDHVAVHRMRDVWLSEGFADQPVPERHGLHPRRHEAAGAAGQDRRREVLPDP